MVGTKKYRWRKVTDINREYALFELLEDDILLLDVGFSDDGNFEIAFNPGICGKVMEWAQLLTLVDEGRALSEQDRN